MSKILIVDDDATFTQMVQFVLEKDGFQVVSEMDGNVVAAAAKTGLPDLILLDLALPNKNGYDVLGELKRDPLTAKIPVLVITAYERKDYLAAAIAAGATGCLIKPVRLEKLREQMNKVLDVRDRVAAG